MEIEGRGCATLVDLVRLRGELSGDQPALVYEDRHLDFAALDRASERVASGLLAGGVQPGERVSILDRNSQVFFEVLFGTVKAGAALVTVNFRLAIPEIRYILADSATRVLFVGAEYLEAIKACRKELPALREVIVLDGDAGTYRAWRDEHRAAGRCPDVDPESAAVQMYTSGTTGNPKGVELSHRAMVNAAEAGLSVWPFLFEPGSAVLGTMPLFHIAACNLCLAAMFAGARSDIVRETSPEQLARIITERGITLVPVPATLIHGMLRLPDIRERDFSALQVMLIAGSGIAEELIREATEVFNCGFALSYGSTETCGGVTYLGPGECTSGAGDRLKSAGRELWESAIRIVDANGEECPRGVTGEILCHSNRLMTAYWNRPEATAEALRDGWFHSGDAGFVDEDGYLFVVDRIKDMVITGGENVYPTEVEGALHQHAEVEDVAVVGIPDEKWGESLLAFVVRKPGSGVEGAELQEFLRSRLAGYKIPRRYEFVDGFPRNATGKVLKRELRAPYWHDRNRQIG